jgi:hypothetical protein
LRHWSTTIRTTIESKYNEDANGVKAGVVLAGSGVGRVVFDEGGEESPTTLVYAIRFYTP